MSAAVIAKTSSRPIYNKGDFMGVGRAMHGRSAAQAAHNLQIGNQSQFSGQMPQGDRTSGVAT
jgi:hypothetical protein